VTLDEIPVDAEYEGPGPMFVWVAERNRWVDFNLAEYYRMTPETTRLAPAAAPAWDQVAILAERIRALLLYAGIASKCQACGERMVWIRDPHGNGKGFNPDGVVHDEVCTRRPAPVEASGPLFAQSGD